MSAQQHKVFSRFQGWSGEVPEGLLVEWLGDRVPAALLGRRWTPRVRSAAASAPAFDEEYFEWIDVLEMALQAGRCLYVPRARRRIRPVVVADSVGRAAARKTVQAGAGRSGAKARPPDP